MSTELDELLQTFRNELYLLFRRYYRLDRQLLLRSELVETFDAHVATEAGAGLAGTQFAQMIQSAQEALLIQPYMVWAVRPKIGSWKYFEFHTEEMRCREIPVAGFLARKESLVAENKRDEEWVLQVDLQPFERGFPRLKEARSIGSGVEFLNRHLASRLFANGGEGLERLFEFLTVHQVRGRQLLLNSIVPDVDGLREALASAMECLERHQPDVEWSGVASELRPLGFEPGWGRTVKHIAGTMSLLVDLLEAPSPDNLARFLRRIPMIFSIAIISPHGYFGQADVLGKPDTGGQVVYILDQVRALEHAMRATLWNQGLDDIEPRILVLTRLLGEADGTTCDQRIEQIVGTEHATILRVPFRDESGREIPQWISRFMIWPYLERFAVESEREIRTELGGNPDFIIGNYSDGNLVASILSRRLGVTQCNIAHALEKTKYLHSALYWSDHEKSHHFECQFTADLVAMNTADFIITSTYQEIAGTKDTVGQYESYRCFSLPDLYRVTCGVDVFDPKFNVVSPGANEDVFFPLTETDRRVSEVRDEIAAMIFGSQTADTRGEIRDRDKPLLMAMSRLDRIKNMNSLVDWYGGSQELRNEANLLIVGGSIDPNASHDLEERAQIEAMHQLFDEHDLGGQVRWIPMQTDKNIVGELYRFVGDTRGAFVQPALFEAFGLTVIEAMTCGLPTFATRYGGPLETIEHGISGFHIDPNHGAEVASQMAAFLRRCREDPSHWDAISSGGVERARARYTWSHYAARLLALSKIYGFWRFITNIEREETNRYIEMLYGLVYRPLAKKVLEA